MTEQTEESCQYLSNHTAKKDSTTTPVRIVFDCSLKSHSDSVSLNDILFSGPRMVQELSQMLIRFRLGPYAVCADISKALILNG